MFLIVKKSVDDVAEWTSNYVKQRINKYGSSNFDPFVLGLPTGSTPIPVYQRLIEFYKNKEMSFQDVQTFNMDEYVGIPSWHPESYRTYMWDNFFSHVDLKPENINLLDGDSDNPEEECRNYERKIKKAGGINLFLAGWGRWSYRI